MQAILDDMRKKWQEFQNYPNGMTIAGCIAGMEQFGKLDAAITASRELPTDWK